MIKIKCDEGISMKKCHRLALFVFIVLAAMSAMTVAASDADWKAYPLKYAGTIFLPSDWEVTFPPPGIEALADTSKFWIEFLATSSEDTKLKAELTALRFKDRSMRGRIPQSVPHWRLMAELAIKAKYKPELETGTFSHRSEYSFDEGTMRGAVFTYEIRSADESPELRIKFLLIYYDNQIFLLRMHYSPNLEDSAAKAISGIRSRWKMPPPSFSFPWFWVIGGLATAMGIFFLLRLRRWSDEDF